MNGLQRWLPGVALASILLLTLRGTFLMADLAVRANVDGTLAAILTGFLFAVGIIHILTIRFVFLPRALASPDVGYDQAILVSYGFAVAPAVYAVVVPLFTGHGLLALPFGAMALCGWLITWSYLRQMKVS
jgi:hypothetical protein